MNENNDENWKEIPITVEEISPDDEEFYQDSASDSSAGSSSASPSTPETGLPDENTYPEQSADSASAGGASSMDLTGTEALTEAVPDTSAVTLEQIHQDLLIIMFMLLFFWVYERIKVGIRNFKKLTK